MPVSSPRPAIPPDRSLCHNGFRSGGPIFPPFADDVPALLESWRDLLKRHPRTLYPGHGTPFDVALLRAKLDSMSARRP